MIDETFEAVVLKWEGTAVADHQTDIGRTRTLIEALCAAGMHVFVVSSTDVETIDSQLAARPVGRGQLFLCCNRGSEIFSVTAHGPMLVHRRAPSAEEDRALDHAATTVLERLNELGLSAKVLTGGLNRRTIDLIPAPQWANPKKTEIARLAEALGEQLATTEIADLAEVVTLATEAARSAGLSDPRVTSDVKHVELGLTDNSESAHFAASWLKELGITGALILVIGDQFGPVGGLAGSDSLLMIKELRRAVVVSVGIEPDGLPTGVIGLGGGSERLITLFQAQLARRAAHRVTQIDPDPAWVLPLPDGRSAERAVEALGTLGNGYVGTRAAREDSATGSSPVFLVAGVYDEHDRLLAGPAWSNLKLDRAPDNQADPRQLDLHTGVLVRGAGGGPGLCSVRFVSATAPHAMALRAELPNSWVKPAASEPSPVGNEVSPSVQLATSAPGRPTIAVASRDRAARLGRRRVVERLAAWSTGPGEQRTSSDATHLLGDLEVLGFDALLADHRAAWARRWKDAEIVIEGDPKAELAARFAVFHLLATAKDTGESAVGARGLTGDAYAGHVFWDADVFVLPALCSLAPRAARAMLEYRIQRLPAARAAAKARGHGGARFPWESAALGNEVSPTTVHGMHGEVIPILTGLHEEHIVADVAWAAAHYAAWTDDDHFLDGPGRDLVAETARYWASRIRSDQCGHGHIYGVMGPDEYHEVVDDNAFTNVMARWNLREGATLLERSGALEEATRWRTLAGSLVDGYRPELGVYEQFAGYFALEPLVVSNFAKPPIAIDMLLGHERVATSQLIKQADVLMLHHLVPNEVVAGSLLPCLSFYEPRNAHGSSLSPAISAVLFARAGEPERALELFDIAARLDLDDLTKTTAGGVHLATMGGLWQALAYGFLGLSARGETLGVDPCLPGRWSALSLRLYFRGRKIGIRAEHDRVLISCNAPLVVSVRGQRRRAVDPPGATIALAPPDPRRRAS